MGSSGRSGIPSRFTDSLRYRPRDPDRRLGLSLDGFIGENPVRIVGIGGSTRQGSKSLALLKHALRVAADTGAIATLGDVRALALPLYDDDLPLSAYPLALSAL